MSQDPTMLELCNTVDWNQFASGEPNLLSTSELLQEHLPSDLVKLLMVYLIDQNAFMKAIRRGNLEEVKYVILCIRPMLKTLLAQKNFRVQVDSMLCLAVNRNNIDIFKLLCESGLVGSTLTLHDSFKLAIKLNRSKIAGYIWHWDKSLSTDDALDEYFWPLSNFKKQDLKILVSMMATNVFKQAYLKFPQYARRLFRAAIRSGELDTVRWAVDSNDELNLLSENDLAQAVTMASFKGFKDIVYYLTAIKRVDLANVKHERLVSAVSSNDPRATKWLISKGAQVSWCSYKCIREAISPSGSAGALRASLACGSLAVIDGVPASEPQASEARRSALLTGGEALKEVIQLVPLGDHALLDESIARTIKAQHLRTVFFIATLEPKLTSLHAKAICKVLELWSANWGVSPSDMPSILRVEKYCDCDLKSWLFREIQLQAMGYPYLNTEEHMCTVYIVHCPTTLRRVMNISSTEAIDMLWHALRLGKIKSIKILLESGADLKVWFEELSDFVKSRQAPADCLKKIENKLNEIHLDSCTNLLEDLCLQVKDLFKDLNKK